MPDDEVERRRDGCIFALLSTPHNRHSTCLSGGLASQHHLVSAQNHLAFRAESMDMWREAATTA